MDIFTRLATQQLARAPLLRPALRSHFAPRHSGLPPDGGKLDLQDAASAFASEGPVSQYASDGARSATAVSATLKPNTPTTVAHVRAESSPLSDRRSTSAHGISASRPAHRQPPAAEAPRHRASRAASPDPIPAPRAPARGAAPGVDGKTSPLPLPALAAVHGARSAPQASIASPLSAPRIQVLSSPTPPQARAELPPVVHLHIDRIEVRAPAAPARPAPSRAPPQRASSTSLSDYLRRGSRG